MDDADEIATIIAHYLARRLRRVLPELLPRGASASFDDLALFVAGQAIPILHTVLTEDDPLAALDEVEALEALFGGADDGAV